MFFHAKGLSCRAAPERPDAALASRLHELLGGRAGVMTGAMQCLMQAWNCRAPEKYRQMLLNIGAEKLGHVELLVSAAGALLRAEASAERANAPGPPRAVPAIGAPHLLHAGLGAMLADSTGRAWSADAIVATGNLLADLRAGVALESLARLQAARLHTFTADSGVRELLGFLISRHTAHQNQFLAAIDELLAEGLESAIVPGAFPQDHEHHALSYRYWGFSADGESAAGRWARGPSPDGRGRFEFFEQPFPSGASRDGAAPPEPPPPDPRLFRTGADHRPAPPGGLRLHTRQRPPIGAAMRGEV